jgi:hypothetical protein
MEGSSRGSVRPASVPPAVTTEVPGLGRLSDGWGIIAVYRVVVPHVGLI